MGELLQLYLGKDHRDTSRAFWLGASRVIDSHPILSSEFAALVAEKLAIQGVTAADAWGCVAEELREAIEHTEAHGKARP